jgi:TPR repeat protein
MPYWFRTQAEYYLRLAQVAGTPEDKAQLFSIACAWHRLGQELDLRDEVEHQRDALAA